MNAIFPGTFDPFTIGHYDIASRATKLFDKLFIAVGYNINKHCLMDVEDRVALISECFKDNPKVDVISYDSLTIELCKLHNINVLIHGIRNIADFEYEKQIAEINRQLYPQLENINFICPPEYSHISSSMVRELHEFGADVSMFMPKGIDINDYL